MICLTEILTENGLLQEKSGVLVNRKKIFSISPDLNSQHLKLYVNFAARIGVEISGIQLPIVTNEALKNTICFNIDNKIDEEVFIIKLENERVVVKSKDEAGLEKAAKYMTCMFPYINTGCTLHDIKKVIEQSISKNISVKEFEVRKIDNRILSIDVLSCDNMSYKIDEPSLKEFYDLNNRSTITNKVYKDIRKHLKQSLHKNIVLDKMPAGCAEAVILLAMRMYLDNFEVSYPILSCKPKADNNNIIIEKSLDEENVIVLDDNNIILRGKEKSFEDIICNFVSGYEELINCNEHYIINEIKDILEAKNELGQALQAIMESNEKKTSIDKIITKGYSSAVFDQASLAKYIKNKTGKEIELRKCNDEKQVGSYDYEFTWEGTELINTFKNEALPLISTKDEIEVYGTLSEDLDVRSDIEKNIRDMLEIRGCKCKDIKIYRSLKPGLSWIEETVIPDVLASINPKGIKKILIVFSSLSNKYGEQHFESESTPNYGQHKDGENKWFDLPTRWLQELYPVDEILSRKFDINLDDVIFEKSDALSNTYRIEFYDKDDNVIYDDEFKVRHVEKPYISRYPKIGNVHITTGGLIVKKGNEIILDKTIDTDMQKVWRAVEEDVLPKLEDYFIKKYGKEKLVNMQPLFNKLQIDITASEVDYDLGIHQERISTIESLQEDLYFYILDYFKTYGERECGKELDNIGLILPDIKNCKYGDCKVSVKLYEDYADNPCFISANDITKIQNDKVDLKVKKLRIENSSIAADIDISCIDTGAIIEKINILEDLIMNQNILKFIVDSKWILNFKVGDIEKALLLRNDNRSENILTEKEKQSIIDNEIISYDRYLQLLAYYRKYDELSIIPIDTTYKGKKIYAIEVIKKDKNIVYSRNKLMMNRITCLFNARHHANEVSSTNSTFMMLDKVLNDDSYYRKLDRVNLIFLPFENIDGGEIHHKMQKDNPKWLYHVARYNSTGYEFRKDYLNDETKYGEARAIPKLWRKWLPDIVTDNHGFESHEFYLQFSGYISPWYKSFWIPRALYYGYIWYDDTKVYMKEYGEKIQMMVTKFINSESQINELNHYWAKRFFKYAEKWHPDMFNTEIHDGLIFYWIERNERKRVCNFALEFPEITTLDWTTEVADETAIDEYLELNSRAHHVSDLAVLNLAYETKIEYETSTENMNGQIIYSKIRKKPLC